MRPIGNMWDVNRLSVRPIGNVGDQQAISEANRACGMSTRHVGGELIRSNVAELDLNSPFD